MNRFYIFSTMILVVGIQACSAEAWKRTTHDALEQRKRMDCQNSLQRDCAEPESYDAYKRKRDDVTKDN